MGKIFRWAKVTKFFVGDENFVQGKFCATLFYRIGYSIFVNAVKQKVLHKMKLIKTNV